MSMSLPPSCTSSAPCDSSAQPRPITGRLGFSPRGFRRLVRASALYDLLLTVGFATPWTLAWLLPQLSALNLALGGEALPEFGPFHALIGHLMGSLVTVWALLRLARPWPLLGRTDAGARALFSLWMAHAWWQTQAPLLLLLLLPEMLWGLAQAWPLRRCAGESPSTDAACPPRP